MLWVVPLVPLLIVGAAVTNWLASPTTDNYRVPSLRPLPVVQPPSRIFCVTREVFARVVVTRSRFPGLPRVQGNQDEATDVEIVVRSASSERSGLHGDAKGVLSVQLLLIEPQWSVGSSKKRSRGRLPHQAPETLGSYQNMDHGSAESHW